MLYHGRVMNHVKYFGIKGGEKHYEKQKALHLDLFLKLVHLSVLNIYLRLNYYDLFL